MARRTRKQMEGNKYEDKLIDKLKIELGLKPANQNKNNKKKGSNKNER